MRVKTFFGADAGRWRWAQGRWMHVVAPERRDQPARGGFSAPDAVSSASGLQHSGSVPRPLGGSRPGMTHVSVQSGAGSSTHSHTHCHTCAQPTQVTARPQALHRMGLSTGGERQEGRHGPTALRMGDAAEPGASSTQSDHRQVVAAVNSRNLRAVWSEYGETCSIVGREGGELEYANI